MAPLQGLDGLHPLDEFCTVYLAIAILIIELEHHVDIGLGEHRLLAYGRCHKLSVIYSSAPVSVNFFEQLFQVNTTAEVPSHLSHAFLDFLYSQLSVFRRIYLEEGVFELFCLIWLQRHCPQVRENMSLEDVLLRESIHVAENLLHHLGIDFLIFDVPSEPWVVQELLSRQSLIRILLQAVHNELDSLRAQNFFRFSKHWPFFDYSLIDIFLCASEEWSITSQHDVDDAPQRPNVDFRII